MLDIIAPASMLAKDQHFQSHTEWIRNISARMHAEGRLEKPWDGQIKGELVKACIDSSRWVAFCSYCGQAEAVDPVEKVFFCFGCNMLENDYQAAPVEFPDPSLLSQIIAALMERPVLQGHGPTRYERIVRMRPQIHFDLQGKRFSLARAWHWSESVEDLHAQQDTLIAEFKKRNEDRRLAELEKLNVVEETEEQREERMFEKFEGRQLYKLTRKEEDAAQKDEQRRADNRKAEVEADLAKRIKRSEDEAQGLVPVFDDDGKEVTPVKPVKSVLKSKGGVP